MQNSEKRMFMAILLMIYENNIILQLINEQIVVYTYKNTYSAVKKKKKQVADEADKQVGKGHPWQYILEML